MASIFQSLKYAQTIIKQNSLTICQTLHPNLSGTYSTIKKHTIYLAPFPAIILQCLDIDQQTSELIDP